jgi:hypothetical protein
MESDLQEQLPWISSFCALAENRRLLPLVIRFSDSRQPCRGGAAGHTRGRVFSPFRNCWRGHYPVDALRAVL